MFSGCGKTVFVGKLLKHLDDMCNVKFKKILFYYSEFQSAYKVDYGREIDYREGLPKLEDYSYDNEEPKLLILDDLMRDSKDSVVADLFTRGSHHKNLSLFFITQNLFHQNKHCRDISLNTHYILLFKNPREKAFIMYLAKQINPENVRFVQECYLDATSEPHGYLLIDLKQDTPESYRYRTKIFPTDPYNYVYLPRKRI